MLGYQDFCFLFLGLPAGPIVNKVNALIQLAYFEILTQRSPTFFSSLPIFDVNHPRFPTTIFY